MGCVGSTDTTEPASSSDGATKDPASKVKPEGKKDKKAHHVRNIAQFHGRRKVCLLTLLVSECLEACGLLLGQKSASWKHC